MKPAKSVAPSGTVCWSVTVPPAALYAVAKASAWPLPAALVSLTTAAFL
ncbi:unannotated protein [freshwater metagenome]